MFIYICFSTLYHTPSNIRYYSLFAGVRPEEPTLLTHMISPLHANPSRQRVCSTRPFDIGFVYLQVKTDFYILNLVEHMIIMDSHYIISKTPVCDPLNGMVTADMSTSTGKPSLS